MTMFPGSENFFKTRSDLSMIWPSFCITEPRLSDQFQKRSLVVGDDADGADDADDDIHYRTDWVHDLLKFFWYMFWFQQTLAMLMVANQKAKGQRLDFHYKPWDIRNDGLIWKTFINEHDIVKLKQSFCSTVHQQPDFVSIKISKEDASFRRQQLPVQEKAFNESKG